MVTLVSLFVLLVLNRAWAVPFCPQSISQIAGPRAVSDFVFKTAIVGDDDRRTLKDFSKETGESERVIAQRYSASGDILCRGKISQASVVLKGDIILVAGHALYDDRDCEKSVDIKDCKAYFVENGKRVAYDIAKEEAEGFACPDSTTMKPSKDWAILRLKKPVVPSIKPYAIKAAPCASEESPADVTFVGKSYDFKRPANIRVIDAPRHYGRCKILKGVCGNPTYPLMTSDCDEDGGSSGGGTFVGDVEPQLIGILSGLRNTCPASASQKSGPYMRNVGAQRSCLLAANCRTSLSVWLTNEVMRTIEDRTKYYC